MPSPQRVFSRQLHVSGDMIMFCYSEAHAMTTGNDKKIEPVGLAEWKRVHALLMDKEVSFADLAVEHAVGKITVADLDKAQAEVLALRELADTVFHKTFGVDRRRPSA